MGAYVEREAATALRGWLRDAATSGGLLLLVGDAGVGKTRLLQEAVPEELAGFEVVAAEPGDGNLIHRIVAEAPARPRLAIWIEGLERFLPGPFQLTGDTSVTAEALHALFDLPGPVVVLATIWPQYLLTLRATDEGRLCYPDAAAIVDLPARCEIVLPGFTADPHPGLGAVLAGYSGMLQRYRRASAEQSAVLNAALDAWRLGVRAPLSRSALAAIAGGYLNGRYRDDSWFLATVAVLVGPEGGVAPLAVAGRPDAGGGYAIAGYLVQALHAERRSTRVPEPAWRALVANVTDLRDIGRLAGAAERRGLSDYAAACYRRLDAADLVERLDWHRVLDRVRYLADRGAWTAAHWLADLLGRQGRVDELRARASQSAELYAGNSLADLLFERGDVAELRALTPSPVRLLAELLAARGEVDELRELVSSGDTWASVGLAEVLLRQERVDEAVQELIEAAYRGNSRASTMLADTLMEHGRIDELRAQSRSRDEHAIRRLALYLADEGRTAEVFAEAATGDEHARRLATAMIQMGRVGDRPDWYVPPVGATVVRTPPAVYEARALRMQADAGDPDAARQMLGLLAEHELVDELRAEVDAGVEFAVERLIAVLARPRRDS